MTLAELRQVVLRRFPELADARFTLLGQGWDSVAIDADDRLVFKFPLHDAAGRALEREAALLALVRPAVDLPVPDLALHDGPPRFSRHRKLAGGHLLAPQYHRLSETARQRLAAGLALFYAQLHRLDEAVVAAAGAVPVKPWASPEHILRVAWPRLTDRLRRHAEDCMRAWQDLPPDPHGTTYGHFDVHGWNMAFDHAAHRLNGLYDFADSGFAPLHQEFMYPSWIARDLTARIVDAYEGLAGRHLDRDRIALLTSVLRLSELAEIPTDHPHAVTALQAVADWAETDS